MAQQKEVLKKEKETAEKIAARAYTQQYLADLLPAVFTSLRSHGYFYDSVERGQLPVAALPSCTTRTQLPFSNTGGHQCTPWTLLPPVAWYTTSFILYVKLLFWVFNLFFFIIFVVCFPDIETHFLPWLTDEVNNTLEKRFLARQMLDSKRRLYNIFRLRHSCVWFLQLPNLSAAVFRSICSIFSLSSAQTQRCLVTKYHITKQHNWWKTQR